MKRRMQKIRSVIFHIRLWMNRRIIDPLLSVAGRIKYPGEEDISMRDIGRFFIEGLKKGDIQQRASSIAFDFFLALFPSIIFIFTLIPYIPVDGIQDKILLLMKDILPPNTFEAAEGTIIDILSQPRGGLLSFGFLMALYVSTNGINSLIEGFNASYHGIEVRSAFKQRLVSLFLTLMLSVIVIISIALILIAEFTSNYLVTQHLLKAGPQLFMLRAGTWIILLAMSLTMISCLFFFGPSKKNRRPFISVGSVTATVMLFLTTLIFNYVVGNFGQYNKIYGSIGTLIVILLWINFNSLQLIIGFELNASIENAQRKAMLKEKQERLEKKVYRSI